MKIEIIKKDKLEGVFYFVYVDGSCDNVYADPLKAEERFNYLVERAKFPVTEELIKSIEI